MSFTIVKHVATLAAFAAGSASASAEWACKGTMLRPVIDMMSMAGSSSLNNFPAELAEELFSGCARVDLSHTNIVDADMLFLAPLLLHMPPEVTEVDLSHNSIGPEGAAFIASVLKSNSKLQRIDLSYNRIGDSGVYLLVQAVYGQQPEVNTALVEMDLSMNSGVGPNGLACVQNFPVVNLAANDSGVEIEIGSGSGGSGEDDDSMPTELEADESTQVPTTNTPGVSSIIRMDVYFRTAGTRLVTRGDDWGFGSFRPDDDDDWTGSSSFSWWDDDDWSARKGDCTHIHVSEHLLEISMPEVTQEGIVWSIGGDLKTDSGGSSGSSTSSAIGNFWLWPLIAGAVVLVTIVIVVVAVLVTQRSRRRGAPAGLEAAQSRNKHPCSPSSTVMGPNPAGHSEPLNMPPPYRAPVSTAAAGRDDPLMVPKAWQPTNDEYGTWVANYYSLI